jgi:hypothetical protein
MGTGCSKTDTCRNHESRAKPGAHADERLCKPFGSDCYEPAPVIRAVGTWEGTNLPNTSQASVFWLGI